MKLRDLLERDAIASAVAAHRAATHAPRDTPTLERLHGMDAAVGWGADVARDLRAFRDGSLAWAGVDRGCLLSGPPGCGKTLFARALATTCGVPLVIGSYGLWLGSGQGHQGDLLKGMRKAFADARSSKPTILFIDEIDSFPNRATITLHYARWEIQVVNALLGEIDKFNRAAEQRPPSEIPGTFAFYKTAYAEDVEFTQLAESTQQGYHKLFKMLGAVLDPFQMTDIGRKEIYAVMNKLKDTPRQANHAIDLIRRLFSWCVDHGELEVNPALRMRHTAQRQGDALSFTWSRYRNGVLSVKQEKTGKYLKVPAPAELREVLDATPKVSTHVLTDPDGLPWNKRTFSRAWVQTMVKAGVTNLQNRDLRRTAMVRMAELGGTTIQISAISGHSIDETQRILEVYLPRTAKMAEEMIRIIDADFHSRCAVAAGKRG